MLIIPVCPRSGPHFLDWAELAERGAASCVSVPVYIDGVPRGVITFASLEPGTFSRCSLTHYLLETASIRAPTCRIPYVSA